MFFSKESTKVNTAIIENIPTVTPSKDKIVLVRLDLRACIANLRLSHTNFRKTTPKLFELKLFGNISRFRDFYF
jgi:hypothetical protein